ncbi:hypothetical protein BV22DRAFT_371548 [Leucogyrophana mollusca]|uniref:Uncharacterized protein n=1 Tax=Leucogyrophana mollusca TaxID=85980 RepID=A0ACB8BLS6_9AGAM|nr:hypothetical protein BV22DRAFT_371548 [Leucogyrophana mollusca]
MLCLPIVPPHSCRRRHTSGWSCANILKGQTERVNVIAYTPCGRFIISDSDAKTNQGIGTGEAAVAHLEGRSDEIWTVVITPDGKTVINGSEDGTAHMWDLSTKRPTYMLETLSFTAPLSISPNGCEVIIVSDASTVCNSTGK